MKDIHKNKLDEFFRESLENPELPFEEEDWLLMQRKLDKKNKRRYFLWGIGIGSAAAILLLASGLWFAMPALTPKLNQVVKIPAPGRVEKQTFPELKPANDKHEAVIAKKGSSPVKQTTMLPEMDSFVELLPNNNSLVKNENQVNRASDIESLHTLGISIEVTSANAVLPSVYSAQNIPDSMRTEPKQNPKFRPSIIVGIMASPDFNAVNSFGSVKTGLSGGLTASISVSPKLSITTGILLSKKLYGTAYSNYKPNSSYKFPVDPYYVDADCEVLDIPLNLNYVMLANKQSRLSATAGASSYFMLREDYTYEFQAAYTKPRSYHLKNENRHFMGVANIGLAYERKLNRNTGLSFQPYLKVPLTGIGYGNVNLLSTGLTVNLNVNLSKHAR